MRISADSRRAGITLQADQRLTEHAGAALLGDDPGSQLPRRVVADMHGVAALEVRDPMPFLVAVKADDASRNALRRPHARDVTP